MKFNKYLIKKNGVETEAVFFPKTKIDKQLPISTPFTFPIMDSRFILAKDKMGWWNPLGGHMEEGELWQEALKREAIEEAGVEIGDIRVFGTIVATRLTKRKDTRYPKISQLPMTISSVKNFLNDWSQKETSARIIVGWEKALRLFGKRDDNLQMYQVFKYLVNEFLKIS